MWINCPYLCAYEHNFPLSSSSTPPSPSIIFPFWRVRFWLTLQWALLWVPQTRRYQPVQRALSFPFHDTGFPRSYLLLVICAAMSESPFILGYSAPYSQIQRSSNPFSCNWETLKFKPLALNSPCRSCSSRELDRSDWGTMSSFISHMSYSPL
jgi:hypothetical protein